MFVDFAAVGVDLAVSHQQLELIVLGDACEGASIVIGDEVVPVEDLDDSAGLQPIKKHKPRKNLACTVCR